MRRKRLKHAADILCQMFCGWRLNNSKPEVVKLGSGILEIDALTGNCFFDGQSIPELSIAVELREWLKEDLAAHNIPIETLSHARLKVALSFSEISWNDRQAKGEMFFSGNGGAVKTPTMHRCVVQCESEVATDEAVYPSHFEDLEEWPIGWPAA
jgi:hypothetical protein